MTMTVTSDAGNGKSAGSTTFTTTSAAPAITTSAAAHSITSIPTFTITTTPRSTTTNSISAHETLGTTPTSIIPYSTVTFDATAIQNSSSASISSNTGPTSMSNQSPGAASATTAGSDHRVANGLIGGIAAGVLAAVGILCGIVYLILRRHRRVQQPLGGSHQSVLNHEHTGTPRTMITDSAHRDAHSFGGTESGASALAVCSNSTTVDAQMTEPPHTIDGLGTVDTFDEGKDSGSRDPDEGDAHLSVTDIVGREGPSGTLSPTATSEEMRSRVQQLQDQHSEIVRVRDEASRNVLSREELTRQLARLEVQVALLTAQQWQAPPEYDALSRHGS